MVEMHTKIFQRCMLRFGSWSPMMYGRNVPCIVIHWASIASPLHVLHILASRQTMPKSLYSRFYVCVACSCYEHSPAKRFCLDRIFCTLVFFKVFKLIVFLLPFYSTERNINRIITISQLLSPAFATAAGAKYLCRICIHYALLSWYAADFKICVGKFKFTLLYFAFRCFILGLNIYIFLRFCLKLHNETTIVLLMKRKEHRMRFEEK